MSIKSFHPLSEQEVASMLQVPAYITVLIAAADQKIDKKEADWGRKLVRYRAFTEHVRLHDYYEAVQPRFEDDLEAAVTQWEAGGSEALSQTLKQVNDILPKLEEEYANLLRNSWRTLARKVAEASGGILGFGSIGTEEQTVVDLPMIH
ncbi:MAG: hypothetical protein D6722_13610 [Bacteroidetes bacterium]|nr:MAG: hypothetical protein D6722_13610 [Bacteroidota bacterium]